jgi:phospholipid/cholesterol/gamma-HCH transport system ATP-binding protein
MSSRRLLGGEGPSGPERSGGAAPVQTRTGDGETGPCDVVAAPAERGQFDSSAPAITVAGLAKAFGANPVLDGLDFSVGTGETVCVLGRSGTGKSVLLKTIIALLDPDAGRVEVLGRDLHALDERGRLLARRELGYVFQGAALFDSLTVYENVGFPLLQRRVDDRQVRARVEEVLAEVNLADAIDRFPSELSGGMQKRAGLARAIIERPRIVLYDEPTTGLDPLTTDTINELIQGLKARHGVTSVVVTHDVRSAFSIADRMILLERGRIAAIGTPAEVRRSQDPLVRRFLGLDGDAPAV